MIQPWHSKLANRLLALGIPAFGINGRMVDGVQESYINYRPEATPAQRTQGDALLAAADKRERVQKTMAVLESEYDALTAQQKGILDLAMRRLAVLERLQARPAFARDLGIALDGDELKS